MFVRKKKNRSGTTSVVVVDKHGGKFKELHTVGIANSDEEIEKLLIQGKAWINSYLGVQKLDFDGPKEGGRTLCSQSYAWQCGVNIVERS